MIECSPIAYNTGNPSSIKKAYKTAMGATIVLAVAVSPITFCNANTTETNDTQRLERVCISHTAYESDGEIKMCFDARKEENKQILNEISMLDENWNGYGGASFSEKKIEFFRKLIDQLDSQPVISPTGRSSLYLEYSEGEDTLGFEVFTDKMNMAFVSADRATFSETYKDKFGETINKQVKHYYGHRLH